MGLGSLSRALERAGAPPIREEGIARMREFWTWLEDANTRTNLTRIQGEADFTERHAIDALLPLAHLDAIVGEAGRVVDVGSGCGVPGVPLLIARPQWTVTLVETATRKARCLEELRELCARFSGRLEVVCERAEVVGRDPARRDAAELCVARAVGSIPLVLELTLPLVKPGGAAVLYRGPAEEGELELARAISAQLGGGEVEQHLATLPSGAERSYLVVHKAGPTPERYPRRPGVPSKRPLSA